MTCQNKHLHNHAKTILQDHVSKKTPAQSRQNNITRSDNKTNTHTIKTKQYYKMTCQNKHLHNQNKTTLEDHMSKQTPAQSRKQYYKIRSHVKTNTDTVNTKQYYKTTCQSKHPHNQDKTILQDHMSKQTPTQSSQNNINYKIRSRQNKHLHNQEK